MGAAGLLRHQMRVGRLAEHIFRGKRIGIAPPVNNDFGTLCLLAGISALVGNFTLSLE